MFGFNMHASRSATLVVINNNLMILMVLPLNTLYVYFRVYLHVPFLVMNKQLKIGHFRVPKNLALKARLSAKPLI